MHLKEFLETGAWLTKSRIYLWSGALFLGFAVALIWLGVSSHGLNDFMGRPIGTDFSDVYAAGKLAIQGSPAAAYDWPTHYSMERHIFGTETQFFGWHYPPVFLIVAGALAALPYLPALLIWQVLGFSLYLLAMRACVKRFFSRPAPKSWLFLAVAFPAVFVNLTHGQNGFLTTACFVGALSLLDRRPFLAGLLFGVLCYKPQFGILLPFVLAASRQGRAFAGAALCVCLLAAAATLYFGPDIWTAFLHSTKLSRTIILEQGATGFQKIQSMFAAVRHVGGGIALAYSLQACVSLTVMAGVITIWHRKTDPRVRGAALCLGTLLATPYVLDYDLVLLAPVILLMSAHGMDVGFVPWEKTLIAVLWLIPILSRSIADLSYIPAGFIVMAITFLLLFRKVAFKKISQDNDRAEVSHNTL